VILQSLVDIRNQQKELHDYDELVKGILALLETNEYFTFDEIDQFFKVISFK